MNRTDQPEKEREEQEFEIFVHPPAASPKAMMVKSHYTVGATITASGASGEVYVYVGDPAVGIFEDDEAAVPSEDLAQTLQEIGVKQHSHVSWHTCQVIEVTVRYNADEVEKKFPPSSLISSITKWAKNKLHLHDAAADELVLQISNTNTRPRPEVRLVELVHSNSCRISFDLVAPQLIQG